MSSLYSIDKLSFSFFSTFSTLSFSFQYFLLFLKSFKELCSSSYSFHFRHLLFNGIMKKAIPSQNTNMTNPMGFFTQARTRTFHLLEGSTSLLYVPELFHYKQLLSLTILSSPFSSSTIFHRSPTIYAPIFLVAKSLSPIKAMFQT